MNEFSSPKRLVDEGADDFERGLLRAAREDAMSDASKAALLATLAAATAAGPADAALASKALGTAAGTSSLALKVVVLLGIALLSAGVFVVARPPERRTAPVTVASTDPRATPSLSEPAPSASIVERQAVLGRGTSLAPVASGAVSREAVLPVPARAPSTLPPATAPSVARPDPADDLAGETLALADARSALREGDADRALVLLDGFAESHPHARLADEATVLRIEAHAAKGDARRARSLGTAWLRDHGASAYADRVRRTLASVDSAERGGSGR